MSRFDSESYRRYRPLYPAVVFERLVKELGRRGFTRPWQVADIGCGTGNSAISLLKALGPGEGARIDGVDPDERMLAEARLTPGLEHVHFTRGEGEATGLESDAYDALLVGSALHWMHPERTRDEFLRLLKPRGLIAAFEYQFPKALELPELNEWIRRGFNLDWKAPGQTPRGDFTHVTRAFRAAPELELLEDRRFPMILRLTAPDVAGLLFSQSRYLHFEATLPPESRDRQRADIAQRVAERMPEGSAEFDFLLRGATFGLIVSP